MFADIGFKLWELLTIRNEILEERLKANCLKVHDSSFQRLLQCLLAVSIAVNEKKVL